MNSNNNPIAIFDSGVGGLSVFREIQALLPSENLIYFADQIHVPYGSREQNEVTQFSEEISEYFISKGAKIIVVACNTASAASLKSLRSNYPDIHFVGMEPAVKPASESTITGKIGVLATAITLKGRLYASVVDRFAKGVEIYESTCLGLVEQIEIGNLNGKVTKAILEDALLPMIKEGIDIVVLGCTHYPFVTHLIQDLVGKDVQVIDPAPAIARRVKSIGEEFDLLSKGPQRSQATFISSGSLNKFSSLLDEWRFEGNKKSAKWNNSALLVN